MVWCSAIIVLKFLIIYAQGAAHFHFAVGHSNDGGQPCAEGGGVTVLLDFITEKEKPLSLVFCEVLSLVSQKPFPLFDSPLCPWAWQLGVHLLLH